MNPILKNSLAVIAGLVIGSAVNMGIIMISGSIIPPPEGADTATMEGLKAAMHLFEPKHFMFPFLAHALGTGVGAFMAALIAANHKMRFAMAIGVFFLIGGVSMAVMVPAPLWFNVLDLTFAYMPMAWLGWRLTKKNV